MAIGVIRGLPQVGTLSSRVDIGEVCMFVSLRRMAANF